MSPIAPVIAELSARIGELSGWLGRRVAVDEAEVGERHGMLDLQPPGLWSPNRSCRLAPAADGWIAVNLAREEDRELVSAWLEGAVRSAAWPALLEAVRARPWRELVAQARLLGLPVAGVGEVRGDRLDAPLIPLGAPVAPGRATLQVVDLSSLWAGPLCGSILAGMGASVLKVESPRRPDPVRNATPTLYQRLNGGKSELALDFAEAAGRARLRDLLLTADVVITSARPRAFSQLGLPPAALFAANPGLVWVAVTGYGWNGEGADRVAFGDDAAAAGGLVRWTRGGPRFLGDALADPLTGLAAAAGALQALSQGGGVLVDAALARTAAGAAARIAGRAAA